MIKKQSKRRGAAIIEAALVLGILLSLSLGGAEAAFYLWVKHVMEGAAWNGARAAITANATDADVQTAITNAISDSSLQSKYVSYTVTPTASSAAQGAPITVTVTYNWQAGGFHFLNLFGNTANASAVMRKEGS